MIPIEKIAADYGLSMATVIQACRIQLQTASVQDLNTLIQDTSINWQEVALLSRLHRIRPVVFRVLMESQAPVAVKERFKKELQANALLNFSIASETERIIGLLQKANITAIPYKGVAFSKQFYGDISMRESSDIDLIIESADLIKTFPIFEKEGYSSIHLELYQRLGHARYTVAEKDLCFDKTDPNGQALHVELHYMITHPRFGAPYQINQFDHRAAAAGELHQSASPFLHAAEHFRAVMLHHLLHDGLEYLKTFLDLAMGVKKLSASTPQEAAPTAIDFSLEGAIASLDKHYHTPVLFYAMEQLMGVRKPALPDQLSLPLQTAAAVHTNDVQKLANYFIAYNLRSAAGRYKRHRVLSLLFHYKSTIAHRAKLIRNGKARRVFKRRLWINLFMPQLADKKALPLPRYLQPFYFIIRPIRILLRKKSDA